MTATAPLPRTAVAAPRPTVRGSRRRRHRRLQVVRFVLATIVCVVMAFPIYWMTVVAFSPRQELFTDRFALWPSTLTLDNFVQVFTRFDVVTWFGNSVVITAFVTVLGTFANLLAGYAFAKMRFLGKNALFFAALATLVLPVQVTMVAQFRLITQLGLYGTYWAVILPSAATATGIFLARQFVLGIPDELLEAAKLDGASEVQAFFRIIIPYIQGTILTVTTTVAIGTLKIFDVVYVMTGGQYGTSVVGTEFYRQFFTNRNFGYGAAIAIVLFIVISPVIVYNLRQLQKQEAF
jgi:ABC-type glycerol-3-phosphate transport system permease component